MEQRSEEQKEARQRSSPEPETVTNRDARDESEGVLVLVCFKCGTEYFFADEEPDPDLSCGKCGNTVFRTYFSHVEEGEADEDYRAATERDLAPDDAEGDTLPGDLIDLDDIRA